MSSKNDIYRLTDNNAVRILVVADEIDPSFSRNIIEYAVLIPQVDREKIETSLVDVRELLNNQDEIAALALKLSSVVFNQSGVWGIYCHDRELSDEYIERHIGTLSNHKVTVDNTSPYIRLPNATVFKLSMTTDHFDLLISPIEMISNPN